jgi:hypothetical protein
MAEPIEEDDCQLLTIRSRHYCQRGTGGETNPEFLNSFMVHKQTQGLLRLQEKPPVHCD